ncbi:MAG: hypothetical protein DMF87_16760 [Acidobacteria bacterium]|nr:MAG: hypothetical protein DMF87_16760 [Acidobacteriota bacterium]
METEMTEFDGNPQKRRLVRRPAEGKIAGVCAGLAEYFDADVALVRAAWVILSIWPGAIVLGVVAYLAAWILMPRAEGTAASSTRARLVRSNTDKRIAGVCGGLAEYFNLDPTIVRVAWIVVSVIPGLIVFGAIAYLMAWFIIPPAPLATLHTSPSTA